MQTNSTEWSNSSAGSEHLPYKQGVLGSNPSGTTETTSNEVVFFYFTAGVAKWVAREGELCLFNIKQTEFQVHFQ